MYRCLIQGCYELHPYVGMVKVLYCMLFPPPLCMMTTVQPRTTGSEVKAKKNPGFESQIYYLSQKGGGGGGGGGNPASCIQK